LEFDNVLAGNCPFKLNVLLNRCRCYDGVFVFLIEVIDNNVEHEPIQLGFGQRVCPFQLDGILRSQHEKGARHRIRDALNGNLQLLHGFQQSRLRFGRRAVDFICKQNIGENGTFHENELALPRGDIFLNDVSAGNICRHQIRRELNALKT